MGRPLYQYLYAYWPYILNFNEHKTISNPPAESIMDVYWPTDV